MTCRQWVTERCPELLHNNCDGGIQGCPHNLGLAEKPRDCKKTDCGDCWDREVRLPDPVTASTTRTPADILRLQMEELLLKTAKCENPNSIATYTEEMLTIYERLREAGTCPVL